MLMQSKIPNLLLLFISGRVTRVYYIYMVFCGLAFDWRGQVTSRIETSSVKTVGHSALRSA
jgi:hypothetical protein